MVNTIVDGTFRQTNLTNESFEYLAKREELRLAEIGLMRQRERVAELRRHLPQGAPIQDYAFEEGPRDLNGGDAPVRTVRLSELFTNPNRSLVIYHLMYGKRQTKACPMCTAWLDGANGVAHHLAQNLDFAVVAAADVQYRRLNCRHTLLQGHEFLPEGGPAVCAPLNHVGNWFSVSNFTLHEE